MTVTRLSPRIWQLEDSVLLEFKSPQTLQEFQEKARLLIEPPIQVVQQTTLSVGSINPSLLNNLIRRDVVNVPHYSLRVSPRTPGLVDLVFVDGDKAELVEVLPSSHVPVVRERLLLEGKFVVGGES